MSGSAKDKALFVADESSPLPLYAQIKNFLAGRIRKGVYPKGSLLPSIAEVEEMSSCGRVTVVRAMRELVKESFATSVNGKGYYVSSKGESALVGLVAPLHSTYLPIYSNLVAGLQAACDRRGLSCIFASSDETSAGFRMALEELVRFRGSRILLLVPPIGDDGAACRKSTSAIARMMDHEGVKVAVVDRETSLDVPHFVQDRGAAAGIILSRAMELGLSNLVLAGRDFKDLDLRSAIRSAGAHPLKASHADFADILEEKSIDHLSSFDGVFCDDINARRLMDHFKDYPPFKIAGYNGTAVAHSAEPTISTVNPNFPLAAESAMRILLEVGNRRKREMFKLSPFMQKGQSF